jgi:hypothetical protein
VLVDVLHGLNMFMYLSLAVFTIVVIKLFQKRNDSATFGIYRKPGRWYFLKLSLMLFILKTRKVVYTNIWSIFIFPVEQAVLIYAKKKI